MKIGIDIDDTMTDITDDLFDEAIKYDKSLGNSGIPFNDNYYIGQRFNWNKDEYKYFMGIVRKNVVNNAKLRVGLLDTLTKLHEEGNKIILITARSNKYYTNVLNMTINWLKKEHIPYDKLIINAVNKTIVCQKEHIDIFLDDDIDNCLKVSKLGIKTFIMDNKNNYLNNNNIERVFDFNAFYKSVKNYIQINK